MWDLLYWLIQKQRKREINHLIGGDGPMRNLVFQLISPCRFTTRFRFYFHPWPNPLMINHYISKKLKSIEVLYYRTVLKVFIQDMQYRVCGFFSTLTSLLTLNFINCISNNVGRLRFWYIGESHLSDRAGRTAAQNQHRF